MSEGDKPIFGSRVRIGAVAYLLLAAVVSWVGYRHPTFQADVVPYAATVLALDTSDIHKIHKKVYDDLVAEIGEERDKQLLASSQWWPSMRNEARYLMEELPFYANRPLYIELAHVLVRAGMDVFSALHVITSVSLFAIACLLLAWLRHPLYAALILLSDVVLVTGKIPTPDALSTAVVVGGLYALFRNRQALGFLLLLVSVFVRTDNAIVVGAAAVWMAMRPQLAAKPGISRRHAVVLIALAAASALAVNHLSGFYGWKAVLINTHRPVIAPGEAVFRLTGKGYLGLVYLGLRSLFSESEIGIWLLVAMVGWKLLKPGAEMREFLLMTAAALVGRFFIFPFPEDRYFLWAYLIAAIALASALVPARRKLVRAAQAGDSEA
jgi:hypothetical protein